MSELARPCTVPSMSFDDVGSAPEIPNETISQVREHRITTPISVSGESNYSRYEGTFPLEMKYNPVAPKTSCLAGCGAGCAATLLRRLYRFEIIINPLNPARTKLFLRFCPRGTATNPGIRFLDIENVLRLSSTFSSPVTAT